jgi:hypothetical protein
MSEKQPEKGVEQFVMEWHTVLLFWQIFLANQSKTYLRI